MGYINATSLKSHLAALLRWHNGALLKHKFLKYSSNSICSSVLFCWLLFIEEFEKLSHEMTSSSSSDFISQMSICSTWIFYAFFSSSAFKRLVKLLLGVLCDLQKYILEGLEVIRYISPFNGSLPIIERVIVSFKHLSTCFLFLIVWTCCNAIIFCRR